ncbi:MAG: TonB-dependent receptor [Pseudomonadota bacterium]
MPARHTSTFALSDRQRGPETTIKANTLVAAVLVPLLSLCASVPLRAQEPLYSFAIPAAPLLEALRDFTAVTGRQVLLPDDDVRRYRSTTLEGDHTAVDGLVLLVSDTALAVSSVDGDTLQLTAPERPESGPSSAPAALEEVYVYGTKQNLTLQKTDVSVELYTAERMEDEVVFTIDDILQRTPNVAVDNVGLSYSIRGVSTDGIGGAGTGSTTQIYLDGVPLSGVALNGLQSLWDLAQVEVLRGPQSTIQGRNAVAGAILAYSQDPSYEWSGKARLHGATQDVVNASFAVGGPIIDDQVAFRIAYDEQSFQGDIQEISTGFDQQYYDVYTARAKLLIEPEAIPDLRVELTGEIADTESADFNFAIAPVPFDDPAFADFDPFGGITHTRINFSDIETDKFIADINYSFDEHWTLIGLATWEETFQGRRLTIGLPEAIDLPLSPSESTTETVSYELRAAFNYERISGWFGAYYFEAESEGEGTTLITLAGVGLPVEPIDSVLAITTSSPSRTTNEAIFADVTIDLNDRWALNLGARYDQESVGDNPTSGTVTADPESCILFGAVPCAVFAAGFAPNEPALPNDFEAFLPRAGLTYQFDDERSISFNVARGYRAGGVRSFLDPQTGMNVINEFDPEFVTNYELAFRSRWLDNRMTVNANLFYTEWEDQQVVVPSAFLDSRLALVENAGESEVYGMELSVSYQASEDLNVYATLGLLETEFLDFPFAEVPGPFENIAGNSFNNAPNTTFSAGLSYDHPSGLYTNWNVSYRGEQYSEIANLSVNEVESATLVNARLGYRRDKWNIYAFANNLFDDRFATQRSYANVDAATGEIVATPNASHRINMARIAGMAP